MQKRKPATHRISHSRRMFHLQSFAIHHRTFSYAIYIAKNHVPPAVFRPLGAYITTPFDWTVTTSSLHTFLLKLALMRCC
ncbi:hypothetical protein C8Q74DRAFT_1242277 [Fomes fomentarius]|nr:hypothetical protein C8Q74DRAFT_1242277 [Fomes fomentarius]